MKKSNRPITLEDEIIERAAMRTMLPWILEIMEKQAEEKAKQKKKGGKL